MKQDLTSFTSACRVCGSDRISTQEIISVTKRHKGRKRDKEVFWFLAETETLDVALSHEHRDHLWLDWEQALAQLTHDETRAVVQKAWEKIKASSQM